MFIEDGEGILTPRSRVFADLADAVWMIDASGSEQISWIEQVLADETRSDSLVLAVSKDQDVADLALTFAPTSTLDVCSSSGFATPPTGFRSARRASKRC